MNRGMGKVGRFASLNCNTEDLKLLPHAIDEANHIDAVGAARGCPSLFDKAVISR
jgi:hypothetical protein